MIWKWIRRDRWQSFLDTSEVCSTEERMILCTTSKAAYDYLIAKYFDFGGIYQVFNYILLFCISHSRNLPLHELKSGPDSRCQVQMHWSKSGPDELIQVRSRWIEVEDNSHFYVVFSHFFNLVYNTVIIM